MFKKLLLVALTSITYASALTLESSDNVNSINSQNEFIAPDSPSFRLGDYTVNEIEHLFINDGEYNSIYIQATIPLSVFQTLSKYTQVYISIPYYQYNSTDMLYMRIDFYNTVSGSYMWSVYDNFSVIPLSETMLANLGFTVVDIPPYTYPPYNYNYFDPALWDYSFLEEVRLSFFVPCSLDLPSGWQNYLRDITLFTKLSNVGYNDGYSDGYSDGYIDGIQEGITQADGTWLGNLIFATVGSVVGFIFAISDFEVLGVSIMSIITLFVGIGIIMLFIKLIKGTN